MVDWIKSSVSRSTAAVASSKTKTWSSLWSLVHQIHLPWFSWGELLRGRLTASGQHSDSHLPRAPHATAHVFKCVDKCYFQVLAVRFEGIIIWPSLGWIFFLPRRPIIYEKTTWRPEGRPDTKSERWDWRREDQTAASLQIYDTRTAVAFLLVFTTCIARTDQDCASGSQRRALDPVGWVLISGWMVGD